MAPGACGCQPYHLPCADCQEIKQPQRSRALRVYTRITLPLFFLFASIFHLLSGFRMRQAPKSFRGHRASGIVAMLPVRLIPRTKSEQESRPETAVN